ncbi:hypothetical protein [Phycicoccus flavus]|uniref:hypothetical protein n=1 Tax=Phycicoccus flavus TaxID=2502783 RepID=UPI000FEB7427|nr:hypothetical protein [Phycicoccus flavus]NHA69976.1 hypothetical protein [Phycicoccus flavus]
MKSTQCLLCEETAGLTTEHIVPQTLWNRFGIDPDADRIEPFRTTLCTPHQEVTAALHRHEAMMDLVETGEPVTRQTLAQLGQWSVWVTMLLSLARGSAVLGPRVTREVLLTYFDGHGGGVPAGTRVYAARVSRFTDPARPPAPRYLLALRRDASVRLDERSTPSGFSFGEGPTQAAESIAIGKIALLVVGPTHSSGPGHHARMDQAVSHLGLERIHPLGERPQPLPSLTTREVCMRDVARLFTVIPFGVDMSLMPERIRMVGSALTSEETLS